MDTSSHLQSWFGLPVVEAEMDIDFVPATSVYRIPFYYDHSLQTQVLEPTAILDRYLQDPSLEQTVALILSMDEDEAILSKLEQFRVRLPALRGLFFGDVVEEEASISMLGKGDLGRALRLFPGLEDLRSRGSADLRFSPCRHIGLRSLIIETGGMPKEVLHGLAGSILPELERLELWLGTEGYGFNGSMEDVLPLLNPALFPKLKHLALGNSDLQNEIAAALADAPILDQLESLDLSLGVMTDAGAEPLLNSARVKKLKKLNLHRNYLSDEMAERFKGLGIEVDVDGQEEPNIWYGEEHRYVAVGE